MDRKQAPKKYYFSKEYISEHFKLLDSFFIEARYNDQIIGVSMFICGEKIAHYHFSGTTTKIKGVYNSELILWEAIKWAKSKNRWFRRASAVILIPSLKKGKQLDKAFEIADILLLDDDDMVQKGYGWMLKVAADKYQDKVYKYVLEHKAEMPRTALRYAIEKMPDKLKAEALN